MQLNVLSHGDVMYCVVVACYDMLWYVVLCFVCVCVLFRQLTDSPTLRHFNWKHQAQKY